MISYRQGGGGSCAQFWTPIGCFRFGQSIPEAAASSSNGWSGWHQRDRYNESTRAIVGLILFRRIVMAVVVAVVFSPILRSPADFNSPPSKASSSSTPRSHAHRRRRIKNRGFFSSRFFPLWRRRRVGPRNVSVGVLRFVFITFCYCYVVFKRP